MKNLIDMKRSKADMKEESANTPVSESQEQYPYGLRIMLDKDELEKMGMKKLPIIGDEFMIEAMCKVVSVSENASENNETSSVSLQIIHLGMEPHQAKPKTALDAMRKAAK